MTLSVVIIGRNAAKDLTLIHAGQPTRLGFADEIIYVDSCSEDESVRIAADLKWRILELDPAGVISAAAGRHAGAAEARGDYILFLDSDMEFGTSIPEDTFRTEIEERLCGEFVGAVGATIDCYPDGTVRRRGIKCQRHGGADTFGGMLLIRRSVLLAAGNWNPCVLANEEIELHARLRKRGFRIRYDERVWCRHYTLDASPLQTLRRAYVPLTARERMHFGSYGLAVRAAIRAGSLFQLMRIAPDPWLALLTAVLLLVPPFRIADVLVLIASCVLIARLRSFAYLAVCPARVLHLIFGLLSYRDRPMLYRLVTVEGAKLPASSQLKP
ncbi:MAG: glycosyltransferase [Verrucomicrobia bacterium]|nr:glycosyltransferase [Verrucomicrobiota bacterium]